MGGGNIAYPFVIAGAKNITMHKHSSIGPGSTIYTTGAKLIIKQHVITGPNLTIITGDHKYIVGRWLDEIGGKDKDPENDQDVIIEEDVWIGANVTILKGVIIGRSSIIAAGAVVTKDIPPFSIAGGVPAKAIRMKWNQEDIELHNNFINANS